METMLLKDPQVFPTMEVLEATLGSNYSVYEELIKEITDSKIGLVPQWRYYNDGKAWLCKVSYKKKTIFWLSVWDKFFKTGFYFTEKSGAGIEKLEIEKNLKKSFRINRTTGKLIPLAIFVKSKKQLKDILTLIEYKKSLK
jgi:hypothetical protein